MLRQDFKLIVQLLTGWSTAALGSTTGEVGDIEVAGWLKIALRGELLRLPGAHPLGLLGAVVGAGEQDRQGPAQAINQKRALVCFKCMPVGVRLRSCRGSGGNFRRWRRFRRPC
jgi:hypothetical protein